MSSIHQKVWVSRTGRKEASILPKLKSLPPTVEAFRENVKRTHFQACIWKAALQLDPPELDPLEFGWASEGPSGAYCPVSLPRRVEVASSVTDIGLHKFINCSCSSDRPCSSQRCSCSSAQLAYSLFCKCEGSSTCCNTKTFSLVQETEHDMDTDSDTVVPATAGPLGERPPALAGHFCNVPTTLPC